VVLVMTGCGRLAFEPVGGDGATQCTDPCAMEPAPLDDTFDRPDGPLGAGWLATPDAFTIANNALQVSTYATALYAEGPVTGDHWVEVALTQLDPMQEVGVVVGARAADPTSDRILVAYHPEVGNPHVHLSVILDGGSLATTSDAVSVPAGSRLRAIARDGMIEVYFDETLTVMHPPMFWPYPDVDGHLGQFASYTGPTVRFDDYGGGTCGCP
jgi:hypothetical protein